MFRILMTGLAVTLALVFVLPGALEAQQAELPTTDSAEDLETWLSEYQQVHLQLEGIQREALQDPELDAVQTALGEKIRKAMEEYDPAISDRIARAQALESEVEDAQQKGDAARLEQLMLEAQEIEQHFVSVQQEVIEQSSLAEEIMAFQSRLERKMEELEPGAAELIARFRELEARIEAALRAGA